LPNQWHFDALNRQTSHATFLPIVGAMSVCDPENGMHHLFSGVLPKHYFVKKTIE
jgi:hypothetical protein